MHPIAKTASSSDTRPKASEGNQAGQAPTASPAGGSSIEPPQPAARPGWGRFSRWAAYAKANRERGMSTAEYAVGTIAACAFAALLFKVVNSTEVQEMLSSLVDRALKTNG
ncbi:DUF4244 domain-containing protein [Nonomuraea pusilla]|uniref:DUF4244 domain-containing protein n=1 Tax=Nonomuraea pusilla TaxID=46177 RepID=A0A1H7QT29_9ACTN|nr:DUF4244 domain-containing protein [Nonomuraea pusilla]SEL51072.1 Protein of unknown function [Nonomuraea pusilla]